MSKNDTIEIQKELFKQGSKLGKYQELILGEKGIFKLLKYELIMLSASWVPGALGLFLRSKLYPMLLGRMGRNVTFGSGVVLRHPKKIVIGDNVVIDDYCVLDAKGTDNSGIFIGNGIFLGRNTILNCKNGDIILKDNVNISSNCMIFSASKVKIEADVLLAAYCYLVGGTHHFDDPEIPILYQKRSSKGIHIGSGGWLGAHVTVFDGVQIGHHVVIGAGSIVNQTIPDYAIAAGSPVRIIKRRKGEKSPKRLKKSVTVGIINYNGETILGETLDSVFKQDYPAIAEIILADNCSTDNSIQMVQKKYPQIQILKMEKNQGPNPARNAIIRKSHSELIFLMDNDIVLSPDVISLLEEAFYQNENAGIVGGQIRLYDEPEKVQYRGCHIHFAGGAILNKLDVEEPVVVGAVSAGAMLVDRSKAQQIGLFDEDFIFGWEDGDFAFRMTIAGYPCLIVAHAHVFHKAEKKGIRWVKYQVRNRWWFILKNYNFRTIVVILPAVLLYQLCIFGFFILKGQLLQFVQGSFSVLTSFPRILRKRQEVMKFKRMQDKQVLSGKNIDLLGDADTSRIVRLSSRGLNMIFSLYWFFAKRLIQ